MLSVTPEQFEQCLELTAMSSMGLVNVCKEIGCTYKAMRYYIDQNDDTRARYAQAKQDQADYIADEMIAIADDDSEDELYTKEVEDKNTGKFKLLTVENKEFVNRSKLKVDTRKWIAAHLKPKSYGDRLDITSDGASLVRNITLTPIPSKSNNDMQLNSVDESDG